ncbi:aconitate hydratase AcnA [Lysinibacillus xylanilyticus]|uniref:aconitate hydratase AcnA n=1 Tax=Lysinibacillus xylanilyticus TaxID=582475 RepID=UPI003CFFE4F3
MLTKNKKFTQKLRNYDYYYHSIVDCCNYLGIDVNEFPYSIRVLLESQVRLFNEGRLSYTDLKNIISSFRTENKKGFMKYYPDRIIVQDYTGIPMLTDLMALREKVAKENGDYSKVSPILQTDIVVDHAIQVESAGEMYSFKFNTDREYEQNIERYKLLKWVENNLDNVTIFPPGSGIIHQINLEYLASLVRKKNYKGQKYLIPDSVIGTDSHTTMINSVGTLGWGTGGIEVESLMLGKEILIPVPQVIGIELIGELKYGATITDLALTLTNKLREHGVVNCFVEFYGDGMEKLTIAERATISNMAPEYGATCAYFPVDDETINYFNDTGRKEVDLNIAREYFENQKLFYDRNNNISYASKLVINLSEISPCVAGPARPQDKIELENLKLSFEKIKKKIKNNNKETEIKDGNILLAAITSCTNTSNPTMMISAGLLAKRAYELGLEVPKYVKTSFSPGSRTVTEYLTQNGLNIYLDKLGFNVTGFGCMTCSGSSGSLKEGYEELILENDLTVTSILSGNRNFEGRIHPLINANYLASPPLVIAFALAGRIDINLLEEHIGISKDNKKIYLKDIWPKKEEVDAILKTISKETYKQAYSGNYDYHVRWSQVPFAKSELFEWENDSTYIKKPPFFESSNEMLTNKIKGARALIILGDSITTDHISPGGRIGLNSPAGQYLKKLNVSPKNFNTYGARRGNHEVMIRGAFGNVHLNNKIVAGKKGGYTYYFPDEELLTIYDAAIKYKKEDTPLLIFAGKEYGGGSSRDWAAKATSLLGVKAVIAKSFERIHKNNLIQMGVWPLRFEDAEDAEILALNGNEEFNLIFENFEPHSNVTIQYRDNNGIKHEFTVILDIDEYEQIKSCKSGGILNQLKVNFRK